MVPFVLQVKSPTRLQELSGEYRLVPGELVNGQPLWKRGGLGSEWYVYSGIDERWYVGAEFHRDKDFLCSQGFATHQMPHSGVMPHLQCSGAWSTHDTDAGKFQKDPGFCVDAGPAKVPPDTLRVQCPTRNRKVAGDYHLVPYELANGQPIWRKVSTSSEPDSYIYSSPSGMWHLGDDNVRFEESFNCDFGHAFHPDKHAGVFPHALKPCRWNTYENYERAEYGGWVADPNFNITAGPNAEARAHTQEEQRAASQARDAPWVLQLRSPGRLQELSGEYRLLPGEFVNSQPLWRRAGIGAVWYLYSGINGCWYVGTQFHEKKGFDCSLGFATSSKPHQGTMPQFIGAWMSHCADSGKMLPDPEFSVKAEPAKVPPDLLYTISPTRNEEISGEYVLVPYEMVNGHPLWKKASKRKEVYVYFSNTGMWHVGDSEARSVEFDCNLGYAFHPQKAADSPSCLPLDGWETFDGQQFTADPEFKLLAPKQSEEKARLKEEARSNVKASQNLAVQQTEPVSQQSCACSAWMPRFLSPCVMQRVDATEEKETDAHVMVT
eukprot:TRINITY_DN27989_c0_g1_i1.p1 TRINITY_DN27989_c0_g1~~TRINITY_DN27989_c0_g1_i1.p1  ORF type:complete len:550 (-),score=70.27 TRINITY_DN27989_c0_g1_i1:164-1813(-)